MNQDNQGFLRNNRLQLSQVTVGKQLPDWSLEPLLGMTPPDLLEQQGKPMLILFFSLGCPGCLGRAIPYANRMVFENKDWLDVIGIHSNFNGMDFSEQKFQDAKDELFIRFPFFRDYNYDTTFLNYGAGGTPHWILVDQFGVVQYSIFGSDPNNALLRLEYVLNEVKLKL